MEKKKKIIIISTIVAVVLVASIVAIAYLSMSRLKVVDNFTIEYGENISNKVADYIVEGTDKKIIDNATIEIVDIDEDLEYPATGDYVVEVIYKNQVKEVIVTVEDTTEPVFKDFKNEINIYTGEQVDWNTLFSAEDLSETIISVDDSAVNYSAEGSYIIRVTATDESDNSVSQVATLNIIQTSLSINTGSVSMKKGQSYTLQSTVVGRNQSVTYTSNNTSVATVDSNGKIVAVGKGATKIVVEVNGLTCEVEVTVVSSSSGNKNNGGNSSSNNNNNSNSGGSQDDDGNAPDTSGTTEGLGHLGDPDDNRDDNDDFEIHG